MSPKFQRKAIPDWNEIFRNKMELVWTAHLIWQIRTENQKLIGSLKCFGSAIILFTSCKHSNFSKSWHISIVNVFKFISIVNCINVSNFCHMFYNRFLEFSRSKFEYLKLQNTTDLHALKFYIKTTQFRIYRFKI